jgi:hypothetical protein
MAKLGGLVLPMYQSEALWVYVNGNISPLPLLAFRVDMNTAPATSPHAVRICMNDKNALTAGPWNSKSMESDPQDYIVCPPQHWFLGITKPANQGERYLYR